MNRHERKRAAGTGDGSKFIEVEVVGGGALLDRPEFLKAAVDFAGRIAKTRPVCLTCERTWTSVKEPPPAAFVFGMTFGTRDVRFASALCAACVGLPDRKERLFVALKAEWPDAELLGPVHVGPGSQQ